MIDWTEVDVDSHFSIDEGNIEGEICRAGTLLRYYADIASMTNAESARAKDRRDRASSYAAIAIRADLTSRNEKSTVDIVKEQVLLSKDYMKAQEEYLETEYDAKKADLYFRSMKQKTDCLIALSYHQRTIIKTDGGA